MDYHSYLIMTILSESLGRRSPHLYGLPLLREKAGRVAQLQSVAVPISMDYPSYWAKIRWMEKGSNVAVPISMDYHSYKSKREWVTAAAGVAVPISMDYHSYDIIIN